MFDWWRRTDGRGRTRRATGGRPKREQLRNAVFDRSVFIGQVPRTPPRARSYSAEKKKLYNMVGALKLHVSLCVTQENRELQNAQLHTKLFSEPATYTDGGNRTSDV